MQQWNFSDGIIPFVIAVAMYGFYLFLPTWTRLGTKWKESQRQLADWRDYEVRVEAPDEASRALLNQKAFDPQSNTLGSLGFEYLGDYIVRVGTQTSQISSTAPLASPDTAKSKQFSLRTLIASRVFVHNEHRCIAFVSAVSSRGLHPLVQIASHGEGWTYVSEAGDPVSGDAGHSSRTLKSYYGAVSPEQLLASHLQCRTQIAHAGGFRWGAPPTMQEIFDEEQGRAARVRKFARHHSPLSLLIWKYQEKRKKHKHWLGELTGKVSLLKSEV